MALSPHQSFMGGAHMIQRPEGIGAFEFVVLATLRAAQLMRGCIPKVEGVHKAAVTAQAEVAAGKIMNIRGEALPVAVVID
jgi:DNA-directed RNA polymerase subunit K/omega